MKNSIYNVLVLVILIIAGSSIAMAEVPDESTFDVSSCSNLGFVDLSRCSLFQGQLDADLRLSVASAITFNVTGVSAGDYCTVVFDSVPNTVDSVILNGVLLTENSEDLYAGYVTSSAINQVTFDGTNFNLKSFTVSCGQQVVDIETIFDFPSITEEDKSFSIISRPTTSQSRGALIETHDFTPKDAFNHSSISFPSFCKKTFLSSTVTLTCERDTAFNDYSIVLTPNGVGDISHAYSASYVVDQDSDFFSASNTIDVVNRPVDRSGAIPINIMTDKGTILMSELKFKDTIYSAQVACPDASSASVIIENKHSGFACEYFSNERTPTGVFSVGFNSDTLVTNSVYCSAPFTISHSGVYEMTGSCAFDGAFCSGPCTTPLPSVLPSDFSSWLSWLEIGKSFFDFYGDNEIADCVCVGDLGNSFLEPLYKEVYSETIDITTEIGDGNTEPRISIDIISPISDVTTSANNYTLSYRITCESEVDCTSIVLEFPLSSEFTLLEGVSPETISLSSGESVDRDFTVLINSGDVPVVSQNGVDPDYSLTGNLVSSLFYLTASYNSNKIAQSAYREITFESLTSVLPVDGVCGSANGTSYDSAPTTDLCSAGTPSVTGALFCTFLGLNGVDDSPTCSANENVDGICDLENLGSCSIGSNPAGDGSYATNPSNYTWTCDGLFDGLTDSCEVEMTCSDGIQNQDETQIDCGGPNCGACVSTEDKCYEAWENLKYIGGTYENLIEKESVYINKETFDSVLVALGVKPSAVISKNSVGGWWETTFYHTDAAYCANEPGVYSCYMTQYFEVFYLDDSYLDSFYSADCSIGLYGNYGDQYCRDDNYIIFTKGGQYDC